MESMKNYRLTESLLPYKHLMEQSNKLSYLLQFHDATKLSTLNQLAGAPHIDEYSPIPKDNTGVDMLLLAQIDFSNIPLQHPFPPNGIIQFFVNKDFGKYDFPKQDEQYFVRYIERNFVSAETLKLYSPTSRIESTPIPYKFSGIIREEPVSSFDYRFETYFNKPNQIISEDERTFLEIYELSFLGAEHKIGGYPYFIHEDFRSNDTHLQKYDTLLLQLVTDDEYEIGYRDSGIISFFIEEAKLINKDFTDVYMHTEHY